MNAEQSSHRVRGAGLDLAVVERGDRSNPTVVLVHGYPDNQRVWEPVAVALATDFHVVTYDVRGAGSSDVPDDVDGFTLSLLTRDFVAVIDSVAPDEQVHLVGHDWGSIQGWEFVCSPRSAGRIASFTSISGPSLDHVRRWMGRQVEPRPTMLHVVRQVAKSWYIGAMRVPGLVPRAWRLVLGRRWPEVMRRSEGIALDAVWPGADVAADGANGVGLYRANILQRSARLSVERTTVPVQVIVPLDDNYVSPTLMRGIESMGEHVARHEVPGGHWVVRRDPARVVGWITRHVAEHPPASG